MIKKIMILLCFVTVWGCMGMESSITDASVSKSDDSASVDFTSSAAKKRKIQADGQAKNNKNKKQKMLEGEPNVDNRDPLKVQTCWQDLPQEVIAHIVFCLADPKLPIDSIRDLKLIELVSKELRTHAKNNITVESVISSLVPKLDVRAPNALMNAAYAGDNESVHAFVTRTGVNLCQRDNFGNAVLFAAGRNNNKLVLGDLLAHGALNCSNNFTRHLISAVILGENEKVALLLPVVQKNNVDDFDGTSPLMYAASNGDNELALLLVKSSDVNLKDNFGNTALIYAALNGHEQTIEMLLQHCASINLCNKAGYSALASAAMRGHKRAVGLLLKHGACLEVDVDHRLSSLHAAAYYGHVDVAQLLLDQGANVNAICKEPWPGRILPVDPTGTPLMLAAANGHRKMVELLLANGADVVAEDLCRDHALSYACMGGDIGIVQLLIEHRGDIDKADGNGVTPLHNAVLCGHFNIVELLIALGAHVDVQQVEGITPVMLAIINNRTKIVELLLSKKADLNLQDADGNTALMHAFQEGNKELAHLLIKHGADVTKVNSEGKSAIDIAQEQNMGDVFTDQFLNAEYSLNKN